MAYVDEEKRAFCIGLFIKYLNTLDTWDKFKTFVNGVTPTKVKTQLKQAFQDQGAANTDSAAQFQELADDDAAMDAEIDVI